MKKTLAAFVILFVFAITVPVSVNAQRCDKKYRKSYSSKQYDARRANYRYNQGYNRRYANRGYSNYNRGYNRRYADNGYVYERRPSFYRRHRNVINIAAGTGAGALIGGLLGGKRGALIGAAVGAGGSALYTYGINPKKKRYYRRY